jgi:hypothetical protein
MKPSVYIETTIPSFYHEVRTEPEMIARRDWTREWWDHHRARYDVFTSEAVIEELEIGTFPGKDHALALITSVPLLAVNDAIADALPSISPTMSCPPIRLGMPSTWPWPPFTNVTFCSPGTVSISPTRTSLAIFDV